MRLLTTLVLFAGCKEGPLLGQFGEEDGLECEEVARTEVDLGTPLPLTSQSGPVTIDPAALLDDLAGDYAEQLEWIATGELSTIEISVTPGETAQAVDYHPVGLDDNAIPNTNGELRCGSWLEFEVSVAISTADGRLDEAFVANARTDGTSTHLERMVSAPAGTIDPITLAPGATVHPNSIHLHLRFAGNGGAVASTGQVLPVLADDPGGDVQSLATWPLGGEED